MKPLGRSSQAPCQGWILYDGQCGFCSRWVHLWQRALESRGFAIRDLQSAFADGTLPLAQENLLDDIRVLTPDGELESGADAYLYVARRLWWALPFYVIFSAPGFNWILWHCYKWFNRNRYRISRQCQLPHNAERLDATKL